MPLRLLLILSLLMQPLTWAVSVSAASASACTADRCCVVVETRSCCGTVERSMRCGQTGGECRCGVLPADPAPRAPAPPPTTERHDLGPFVVVPALTTRPVAMTPGLSRPVSWLVPGRGRDAQARLCVWRT